MRLAKAFLPMVLALPSVLSAEDWVEFRSGPLQVLTNAGDHAGQDALAQLEQLRHVLGQALGKPETRLIWPLRVIVFKDPRQFQRYAGLSLPGLGRDSYMAAAAANQPLPQPFMQAAARLLIDANAARLPAGMDAGLADFYSTIEVNGSRVRAGTPPPQPTVDWARIHLLVVDPAYYGKIRVLLYNLQQASDPEPAYRNAFGKNPAQIDKEVSAHFAAGKFESTDLSGKPLNPRTDFRAMPASSATASLAIADLLSKDPSRAAEARSAYQSILKKQPNSTEALEGLALTGRSPSDLAAAVQAGSQNARVWMEYARQEKKADAAKKAAELNPNWAEPHTLRAQLEPDPARQLAELEAAANAEPRRSELWQAVAVFCQKRDLYPRAAKAWAAAEKAAVDDNQRAQIRQSHKDIEQQRLDYEAAERRRIAEEKQRELQRLKDSAMAEVRAAEVRANRKDAPGTSDQKVELWWDGKQPTGKVTGKLTLVECRKGIRFTIQKQDRKLVKLSIKDPGKVMIVGGGQLDLVCGVQRKPRTVAVEYFPEPDTAAGTAGEIATIEYK